MDIYILVGDEASARLFLTQRVKGNRKGTWKLIQEWEHPESRAHTEDLVTDKLDEAHKSPPRVYEGVRFAKQVADYLDAHQFQFERLVLVGPPRFIGELRKALSGPVTKKLTDSIPKHFGQLAERDLISRLSSEGLSV